MEDESGVVADCEGSGEGMDAASINSFGDLPQTDLWGGLPSFQSFTWHSLHQ